MVNCPIVSNAESTVRERLRTPFNRTGSFKLLECERVADVQSILEDGCTWIAIGVGNGFVQLA
jgi:hypothetical protein